MPQLDTIFIWSIFIWTWLMLFLSQKNYHLSNNLKTKKQPTYNK